MSQEIILKLKEIQVRRFGESAITLEPANPIFYQARIEDKYYKVDDDGNIILYPKGLTDIVRITFGALFLEEREAKTDF